MLNNPNKQSEMVIACNPGAIDPSQRDAHHNASRSIFTKATILEVKELPDGYAFRLPPETHMLHKLAGWIANERLCCPFFTFTLVVNEQLWLHLTGTEGAKALIQSDILQIIENGGFPTIEALEREYEAAKGSAGG